MKPSTGEHCAKRQCRIEHIAEEQTFRYPRPNWPNPSLTFINHDKLSYGSRDLNFPLTEACQKAYEMSSPDARFSPVYVENERTGLSFGEV